MSMPTAISHEEATKLISTQSESVLLGTEWCEVKKAVGRVLAQPIKAPINVPEYDCSRMDGYAVNLDLIAEEADQVFVLKLGDAIHAKAQNQIMACGHQAIPVMTGGLMPSDANGIVLKEQASIKNNHLHFKQLPIEDQYIRKAGTDLKLGQNVINSGQGLSAAHLGVLSSLGLSRVEVFKRPKVALMMSGDELIAPGDDCLPGEIYDANSVMLAHLLTQMGCEVETLGLLKDSEQAVIDRFECLKHQDFDLMVSVGGVSMGDKDWIPGVLHKFGQVVFHKLKVKPGFPMIFGQLGGALYYGLPGNPVSAYTTLCQYLFPAIKAMYKVSDSNEKTGHEKTWQATLGHDLDKSHDRREFMRGFYVCCPESGSKLKVHVCGGQQSSRIESLSDANCFVVLSEESQRLKVGDVVDIQPFSDFRV